MSALARLIEHLLPLCAEREALEEAMAKHRKAASRIHSISDSLRNGARRQRKHADSEETMRRIRILEGAE